MSDSLSFSPGTRMEIKLSHKKCPPLKEIFFLHRESGLNPHRSVHPLSSGDSHTCCRNTVALQSTAQLFQAQDKSLTKCFTKEAVL